jgi:hypothetical protein
MPADRARQARGLPPTRAMGDALMDDLGGALGDFLSNAHGRSVCDGCLAFELHVSRLDVEAALGGRAASMDRGHGRCSICGQTLTVTRLVRD